MGTGQSKQPENVGSIPDMLPELLGCDTKGTVLCPENDTSLTCLNGGVCALFLKEVEDACEKRCKCNTDYIGKHCEFYNGFFTATVTIMVGCLLAVIFTVFLIIIIWYCCNRKSLKGQDAKGMEHRRAKRVSLADRVMNSLKSGKSLEDRRILRKPDPGQAQVHYSMDGEVPTPHMPRGFTSRSYSVYDNVQMDLDEENDMQRQSVEYRGDRHGISPNGTHETAHLITHDGMSNQRLDRPSETKKTDHLLIQMNQICPDDEVQPETKER